MTVRFERILITGSTGFDGRRVIAELFPGGAIYGGRAQARPGDGRLAPADLRLPLGPCGSEQVEAALVRPKSDSLVLPLPTLGAECERFLTGRGLLEASACARESV
jgi:hypothetical protein